MAITATNIAAAALEVYDQFEDAYTGIAPESIPFGLSFSRAYEDVVTDVPDTAALPLTLVTITITVPCLASYDDASQSMQFSPQAVPGTLTFPAT